MNWERQLITHQLNIIIENLDEGKDIVSVIADSGSDHSYLLAHDLDGIIWGKWSNDRLILPDQYSPSFQSDTLYQARVFNSTSEYFWWKASDGWHQRRIIEGNSGEWQVAAFDENQILWGTSSSISQDQQFTVVTEGAQGFYSAIPVSITIPEPIDEGILSERLTLRVRHYLGELANGMNYVAMSRLVAIEQVNFRSAKSTYSTLGA